MVSPARPSRGSAAARSPGLSASLGCGVRGSAQQPPLVPTLMSFLPYFEADPTPHLRRVGTVVSCPI